MAFLRDDLNHPALRWDKSLHKSTYFLPQTVKREQSPLCTADAQIWSDEWHSPYHEVFVQFFSISFSVLLLSMA